MLGQPLELSVPVQMDAEESASNACFEAEVFYGDVRLAADRVTVQADPNPQGGGFLARVSASARVDEPVVTVYLRAGCAQKTGRRYVLLADLASEVAPAAPAPTPVARTMPPPPAPVPAAVPQEHTPPAAASQPMGKPTRVAARPVPAAAPTKPVARKPELPVPVGKREHLKLSPPDIPKRDPGLKISDELLSAPADDLQKRAEAVAQWRALNATPQDVMREDARMQALEGSLKSLQDLTARNKSALTDMASRLERAESQRYANPLVYGLALLVLLSGAALALAWRRLRDANQSASPWWRDSGKTDLVRTSAMASGSWNATVAPARPQPEAPIAFAPSADTVAPESGGGVDIDLGIGGAMFAEADRTVVLPKSPAAPVPATTTRRESEPSGMGMLRAINTQEMLDVRQQADFFMALGQYDEAIQLLTNSIQDSGEANPLVYLDLLKTFHTLSRKDDYDRYRDEFNRLFTGHVPSYTAFNRSGNGLEAYPEVCQRITQHWPSPAAVDFIEQCLARRTATELAQPFDLEAYRDLLMLYGMAKRIEGATDSRLAPFSTTRGLPVLSTGGAGAPDAVLPAAPAPLARIVDLDLSEPDQNLMDFEVSGFSTTDALGKPKP